MSEPSTVSLVHYHQQDDDDDDDDDDDGFSHFPSADSRVQPRNAVPLPEWT